MEGWRRLYQALHQESTFIPEFDRVLLSVNDDPSPLDKRKKRLPIGPTHKGALFHDYCPLVHEFITHLRRVHWKNPDQTINGKTVKAANALAPAGVPLYYLHGRTNQYNDFFFDWFVNCFAKTFIGICPFYEYESVAQLEKLLDAEVER